jgi:hypothetical protein
MCFEVAMAAVSVAQSAVSFAAAGDEYNQRAQQWQDNRRNALAAGRDEQKALSIRMVQEQDAFAQKRHMDAIEEAEASASAEASGAAAGVSGLSLDNILTGIGREAGQKALADKTNYENTVLQLSEEQKSTDTNIKNRINSVQVPTKPNPLGYVLQGIGGGLAAFKDKAGNGS